MTNSASVPICMLQLIHLAIDHLFLYLWEIVQLNNWSCWSI